MQHKVQRQRHAVPRADCRFGQSLKGSIMQHDLVTRARRVIGWRSVPARMAAGCDEGAGDRRPGNLWPTGTPFGQQACPQARLLFTCHSR